MVYYITDKEHQKRLLEWAAPRMPHIGDPTVFNPCETVGIAKDDSLYAVVIYNMFLPSFRSIMVSMVSANSRWCTRPVIKTLLGIPFYQYDCNRVWTLTPHTSERVVRFNKALGFTREGVLREAFGPKLHGVACGMLRHEYDRKYNHGQRVSLGATGT